MVSPAPSVWAMTTSAALLLGACMIYSPSLLVNDDAASGASGAAGAGNPCGTGSKCVDSGPAGSSGAAGSGGSGGEGGAGGTSDPADVPILPYISSTTESAVLSIGLSTEGRIDWAHWGLNKASDYNHKNIPNP